MATFGTDGSTIQYYIIPTTGEYEITADGAQGGRGASGGEGGEGAAVGGDIYLTGGTALEVIVGTEGGNNTIYSGGGGGGGSFVFLTFSNGSPDILLAVAGGGGGGGAVYNGGGARSFSSGGTGGGSSGGIGGRRGASGDFGRFGGGGGGFTGGEGYNYPHPASDGSTAGTSFAGGRGASGGNGGFGGGGGGGAFGGGGGGGYGGGGGGGVSTSGGGGGGGGGSYLNGYFANGTTFKDADTNSGNGDVTVTFVAAGICYLRGTRILTPAGEVAVEALRAGDRVVTRFGGTRAIKWIGRQVFAADEAAEYPVHVRAGALGDGMPARGLWVSPGHSMLIEDRLILAKLLVNGVSITQGPVAGAWIEYFNLDLGVHDCVIAEGVWSETYADAPGMRALFHNAASFTARYPEQAPPAELVLCAERPEHGGRLNDVLQPIVARAAAGITPGRLEGYAERVEDGWRVIGWARDVDYSALPVLLEVCAGEEVLGSVLACDYRADLEVAGKGSGRCAFSFMAPRRLTAEMQEGLQVRRAADGAALASAWAAPVVEAGAAAAPKLRLVG